MTINYIVCYLIPALLKLKNKGLQQNNIQYLIKCDCIISFFEEIESVGFEVVKLPGKTQQKCYFKIGNGQLECKQNLQLTEY